MQMGVLTVAVLGLMALGHSESPVITLEQLAPRLEAEPELAIIDVRAAAEFEAGHLPGAWSLPANNDSPRGLSSRLADVLRPHEGATLIYGGASLDGVALALLLLEDLGVGPVLVLQGGIEAWVSSGRPLEQGPRPARAGDQRPSRAQKVAVSGPWVKERLGASGFEIMDLREGESWEQWVPPASFAAGHIPGSLPFAPGLLVPGEVWSGWPAPEVVRDRIARVGARPDDYVELDSVFTLYSWNREDPALWLTYLLLRHARLKVRVFFGGWEEWRNDPSSAVVRLLTLDEMKNRVGSEPPAQGWQRRLVIDLRERRDFEVGHIPGAVSLPTCALEDFLPFLVEKHRPGLSRDEIELIFYCFDWECVRSRNAASYAATLGYTRLFWFRPGMLEWRQRGQAEESRSSARPAAEP